MSKIHNNKQNLNQLSFKICNRSRVEIHTNLLSFNCSKSLLGTCKPHTCVHSYTLHPLFLTVQIRKVFSIKQILQSSLKPPIEASLNSHSLSLTVQPFFLFGSLDCRPYFRRHHLPFPYYLNKHEGDVYKRQLIVRSNQCEASKR